MSLSVWDRVTGLFGDTRAKTKSAHTWLTVLAGGIFLLCSVLILAYDSIIPGASNVAMLQEGMIAAQDIRAPINLTYVSDVITERRRLSAMADVSPIYDPPDPAVARQQMLLLGQILDFIDNVRGDAFGTRAQKIDDITKITALSLNPEVLDFIVSMDAETWRAVSSEISLVLERVMRESIREVDVSQILDQLPTQVSVRFDNNSAAVVIAFTHDLVRPNRFPNPLATETARQAAAIAISPESRSFERGQVIVRAGTRIEAADYEALSEFGLLESPDRRIASIGRAFLSSLIVLLSFWLYVNRARQSLRTQYGVLLLLGGMFLLTLLGAKLFHGDGGQIYAYPAAALALILVAIIGADIAVLSMVALAFLMGLVADNSLEVAALVGAGGSIGALMLKRSDRLNNYFLVGVIIALSNIVIVSLFNLGGRASAEGYSVTLLLIYAVVNGLLAGMIALAGLYLITLLFNLPTNLKLVELSQPNQPLLQRLLREAPGTYQHSLQVANLSEQAANAIGANAELVRVAALYHDIGKMLNAAFFIENQVDNVNPHDMLKDPYRSASIIISHVTDGEKLARQYRLPQRIRDFILEHHGTTNVAYFYNQAVSQADDDEAVDVDQFTYPGPKPQSPETAILMLADSCESSVRAGKPSNRAEIEAIVGRIFDARAKDGQLNEANLTLNDLQNIRHIFIEMLQAVFHPRINYPSPAQLANRHVESLPEGGNTAEIELPKLPNVSSGSKAETASIPSPLPASQTQTQLIPKREGEEVKPATNPQVTPEIRFTLTQEISPAILDDDDSPLPSVPRLPRNKSNTAEIKPNADPPNEADSKPKPES